MMLTQLILESELMASRPVSPRIVAHNGREEWCTWWFDDGKKRRWRFFGACNRQSAMTRFAAFMVEWEKLDRVRNPQSTAATYKCSELAADYLQHAKSTFVKNGKPTSHVWEISYGMQALMDTLGNRGASTVTAPELARLRDSLVKVTRDEGGEVREYARTIRTVNGRLAAIKSAYRWAREQGLVTADCLLDLLSVRGLTNRCADAKPSESVRPVDEHYVASTKLHLPPVLRDMVDLQWLTGMRPGEVCMMRPCDIDRSGDVWVYTPVEHKTVHLEKPRFVCLGARAQAIVEPYLATRPPAGCVFTPREAHAQRLEMKRAARKTKLWPSHERRYIDRPAERLGEKYDHASYRRAIKYACKLAGIDDWHPNQLRHAWATRVRATFGLDAASAGLGHSSLDTTLIYAEASLDAARNVARKVG